jgi:hypothetical protein
MPEERWNLRHEPCASYDLMQHCEILNPPRLLSTHVILDRKVNLQSVHALEFLTAVRV